MFSNSLARALDRGSILFAFALCEFDEVESKGV
jgi:hypothetical protein